MADETASQEPSLPDYVIEAARSSRAKCKTCRRKIDQGTLRLGLLIEGPYGTGYLWHHLRCAARRHFERLAEAYAAEAWKEAKEPPVDIPSLDSLQRLREDAEERKRQRKTIPHVEQDPSGRARCKHCDEPLSKGAPRVVLGRGVQFGNQVRVAAIHVHPRCVPAELRREDCTTEAAGLDDALRANSEDAAPELLAAALAEIEVASRSVPS